MIKYKSYQPYTVDITPGVSQGSMYGPLLFSIYTNNSIISNMKLKFQMYADDTTISFNLEDFDQKCVETEINNELERVNIWLKLTTLSLNIQKTKLVIFHRKQNKMKDINISIDNVQIERVKTFNFLGIMLDESLTWTEHTNMVANKISSVAGVLHRLKNIFPWEILLTLYNTLILSYINYGLLVWGVKSNRIDVLLKKKINLAANSSYFAHTTPLFLAERLLKVSKNFKFKVIEFFYKLSYDL